VETDTLEKMIRRVECDLDYIRHYSFRFDLRIVLLTVFRRKVLLNSGDVRSIQSPWMPGLSIKLSGMSCTEV